MDKYMYANNQHSNQYRGRPPANASYRRPPPMPRTQNIIPQNIRLSQEKRSIGRQDHRKEPHQSPHMLKKIMSRYLYTIMLTLITSIVVIGLIFLFLSKITISTIRVSGDISLPEELLRSQLRLELPKKYFHINTREIKNNLEEHPLIFNAKVKRGIMGKLFVTLERSNPILSMLAEVNGRMIPVYFDKSGRCVQVGVGLGIVDVPIMSGLTLINPEVGVYMPDWVKDIVKKLELIRIQNKGLYANISEIAIKDKGDAYKVLMISFVGLKSKFMTSMNIDDTFILKVWHLANKIEQSNEPILSSFDYFDIRQGVIIGKRKALYE